MKGLRRKDDTLARFRHVSLGTWDPEGCLVCIIDDPTEAARAVAALQAKGFSAEHIRLVPADEFLAFSNALHRQGMLKRVFFFLANPSDDAAFEAEYRQQARSGHAILMVYAPQREQRTCALAVLRDYHAHYVKYYSPWFVRGFD